MKNISPLLLVDTGFQTVNALNACSSLTRAAGIKRQLLSLVSTNILPEVIFDDINPVIRAG